MGYTGGGLSKNGQGISNPIQPYNIIENENIEEGMVLGTMDSISYRKLGNTSPYLFNKK